MPDAFPRSSSAGLVRWLCAALVAEAIIVAWFGIWLAAQIRGSAPADTLGSLLVVVLFVAHSARTIAVLVGGASVRPVAWLPAHVVSGAVLLVGGVLLLRDSWVGAPLAFVGLLTASTTARHLRTVAIWPPDRIIPALLGGAALVLAVGAVISPAQPDRHAMVRCRAPLVTVFGPDQHLSGHVLVSSHGEQAEVARAFCLPGSRRRLAFSFVVAPLSTVALRVAWRRPDSPPRVRS